MNKILQIPAAAGAILLAGSLAACAGAGTTPEKNPLIAPEKTAATKALPNQPRGLPGKEPKQPKKAPTQARPVDVEAVPWDGTFSSDTEIQVYRIVVDEVWRYCIVNAKGGTHCFDSSDAP
jgi:hypothetical protein